MTWRRAAVWYAAAGVAGLALFAAVGGFPAVQAPAVAWALCLIVFVPPPVRPRVAVVPVNSKIFREQRIWFAATPARMLLVLCGSVLLYSQLGDRLGIGFWLAVLAFYLLALALSVARTLSDLNRNAWRRPCRRL